MPFERQIEDPIIAIGAYQITFTIDPILPDTGKIEYQLVKVSGGKVTEEDDLIEILNEDAAGLIHLTALIALRGYLNIRIPAEALPIP